MFSANLGVRWGACCHLLPTDPLSSKSLTKEKHFQKGTVKTTVNKNDNKSK